MRSGPIDVVFVCPQAEINRLSAKLAAETRQRQELETEVRSRGSSAVWLRAGLCTACMQPEQHSLQGAAGCAVRHQRCCLCVPLPWLVPVTHTCRTPGLCGHTHACMMVLQVTELECRLSSSTGQLAAALDANSQHLERYREAKAEAAGLAQQLDQVCSVLQGVPSCSAAATCTPVCPSLPVGFETDTWAHLSRRLGCCSGRVRFEGFLGKIS